eukprot:8520464-Pyramimonas_sp.AAC.1
MQQGLDSPSTPYRRNCQGLRRGAHAALLTPSPHHHTSSTTDERAARTQGALHYQSVALR